MWPCERRYILVKEHWRPPLPEKREELVCVIWREESLMYRLNWILTCTFQKKRCRGSDDIRWILMFWHCVNPLKSRCFQTLLRSVGSKHWGHVTIAHRCFSLPAASRQVKHHDSHCRQTRITWMAPYNYWSVFYTGVSIYVRTPAHVKENNTWSMVIILAVGYPFP